MSANESSPRFPVPKVSAGGLNIHYRQVGSGPHAVLIHGLTGSLADWYVRVVPHLTSDFTVLTYDLRGHGYTDMPPSGYTSADMSADLANLLDALDIDRAHVIGHSFGGTTALHFAALHPDRVVALTVSDCRVRSLQPTQRLKDWSYWPIWQEQLRRRELALDAEGELDLSMIELLLSQRTAKAKQDTSAAEKRREEQWARLLSSTTADTDLRSSAGLTCELIERIRLPAQAIYAEYSFFLPTLEGLKAHLRGMKSVVIPGSGHLYPVLRPDLFVQHVKAFHAPGSASRTPSTPAGKTSENAH